MMPSVTTALSSACIATSSAIVNAGCTRSRSEPHSTEGRCGTGRLPEKAPKAELIVATCQRIFAKHLGGHDLMSNANHLRGLRSGRVTAVARPVHLGRTTHVWDIRLSGEDGKASCISRLTMAIVPLGENGPALR